MRLGSLLPLTVCDIWKASFVLSELKSPEAFPSPPLPPAPRSFVMSGVGEREREREAEWLVETLFQFGNALREMLKKDSADLLSSIVCGRSSCEGVSE